MNIMKFTLIAAACAALATPAFAEDGPKVSFSGFGTAAAVHNDNSNLDFIGNQRQPNGAGATSSANLAPDTILGVQMNASLTKNLSAVVQVISQHQYDNSFNPAIEWAFVKYQATPNFDITLGRTALPAFSLSDSRLIGFSYLWARPPVDVYFQVPLTTMDGIGASWRKDTPMGQLTLQGGFGSTELNFPNQTKVKGKDTASLSATLESGDFAWRAGYSASKISYNTPKFDSLVGGYAQYGQAMAGFGLTALANEAYAAGNALALNDRSSSFVDLGVTYDKDNWLLQAEWTARKSGSIIADSQAWHASAGYRFGKFTPYLGFSSLKTTSDSSAYPMITGGNATADTLNANAAGAIANGALAQDTTTIGLKWNFRPNMDLKVQYDDVRFRQGTTGTFNNPANSSGNSRAGLTTIALDFVF